MTLPRVYALFNYWAKSPPAHEVMRVAWLKVVETQAPEQSDSAVHEFVQLPGASGNWQGPPPVTVQEVERLAKEARERHGR